MPESRKLLRNFCTKFSVFAMDHAARVVLRMNDVKRGQVGLRQRFIDTQWAGDSLSCRRAVDQLAKIIGHSLDLAC